MVCQERSQGFVSARKIWFNEMEELIEPAIKLAEDGFEITPYMADMLIKYNEKLSAFDETNKVFQTYYP